MLNDMNALYLKIEYNVKISNETEMRFWKMSLGECEREEFYILFANIFFFMPISFTARAYLVRENTENAQTKQKSIPFYFYFSIFYDQSDHITFIYNIGTRDMLMLMFMLMLKMARRIIDIYLKIVIKVFADFGN